MKAFLKNLLTPPKNDYTDIFENTKYLLSYRLTLFLSVALLALSAVLFIFFTLVLSILTFSGFLICLFCFMMIRKTGKFKTFILTFNILGAFLCVFTLYYIKDQPHIVDGLWMVISSTFSFLTLNKKWATAITVTHGILLAVFYMFFMNEQIELLKKLTETQIFATSFNVFICFSIIYYLNWQNLRSTKDAEKQLKNTKVFLEEQFELINSQNDEKTVLLKEIHHRVKNNLQVIVSLLRLQTRDISNEEELKKFNESINRVLAMSLIHEKIYQTEDFSKIDLQDYFKTLAKDMIRSFQVEKPIELDITCKVDNLGLKPIVPVALIFNELLSNSIKYAFTSTENPKISVNLNENIKNFVEFTYADNGTWRPPVRENSFGLELIDTLTEQLNGHFEVYKSNGTKYQFYFDKLNA